MTVVRMTTDGMKWMCCQLGAREHYAIPRALNSSPDGQQIAQVRVNLVFESFVFYLSLPNGCQMVIYLI